jgi:alkylation response protein AidB-like acyl-CoA dehydrogenase
MAAMTIETVRKLAASIAAEVLAPHAERNDRESRFPAEAVDALGKAGLLGLTVPVAHGGLGFGPSLYADVTATLAERCPSTAMIFTMHVSATAVIAAAKPERSDLLGEIARSRHLTTLAFSEKGSRSHFWAPMSRARRAPGGVTINAEKSWVTAAGHAQSYVTTALSPDGSGPTDSTLYLVRGDNPGIAVAGAWDGLGLRANASAPMRLTDCFVPDVDRLTEEGKGFDAKTGVVLPTFNLGCAAMSLGLSRSALAAAKEHVKTARFEHLGATIAAALPTVRAQIAEMQTIVDGIDLRVGANVRALEQPNDLTMLSVLEVKAAAAEAAIAATDLAMRACGGAAFSRHLGIERAFRDARASSVMAPTTAVLNDLLAKAVLGLPLF